MDILALGPTHPPPALARVAETPEAGPLGFFGIAPQISVLGSQIDGFRPDSFKFFRALLSSAEEFSCQCRAGGDGSHAQ